jgi:hypothetical protein
MSTFWATLPYTCHGPGKVVHLHMTGIRQEVTIVIFINTYVDQKDFYQCIQSKMTLIYYMMGLDAISSQTSLDIFSRKSQKKKTRKYYFMSYLFTRFGW